MIRICELPYLQAVLLAPVPFQSRSNWYLDKFHHYKTLKTDNEIEIRKTTFFEMIPFDKTLHHGPFDVFVAVAKDLLKQRVERLVTFWLFFLHFLFSFSVQLVPVNALLTGRRISWRFIITLHHDSSWLNCTCLSFSIERHRFRTFTFKLWPHYASRSFSQFEFHFRRQEERHRQLLHTDPSSQIKFKTKQPR